MLPDHGSLGRYPNMHRRAIVRLIAWGLVAVAFAGLGACSSRGTGAQVQTVDVPPTPIRTPASIATPPRPDPTRHPLTPVAPTPFFITPVPTATARVITPAPTHTPGPTPTNPPNEEAALRQVFADALQERQARGQLKVSPTTKIAISRIRIEGDWAIIGIYRQHLNGTPVAAGGGLVVARKLNGQWKVAFGGDPERNAWLDALPDSLMTPQDRDGPGIR